MRNKARTNLLSNACN
jgi:hypothetical protein